MVDSIEMFMWVLVVSSFGLVLRSLSLQMTVRRLRDALELRDMKIGKLTEQLNMFGGAGEV